MRKSRFSIVTKLREAFPMREENPPSTMSSDIESGAWCACKPCAPRSGRRGQSACGFLNMGLFQQRSFVLVRGYGQTLIVVPVSLDAVSDNWSTTEVVDELARKADCPVLAGKAIASAS